MKNNLKKVLLMSVFATQFMAAPSAWASSSSWSTNCDVVEIHNRASGVSATYLTPLSTNRAIVDSLGKDPKGDVTVHEKLDHATSSLGDLGTAVSGITSSLSTLTEDVTNPSNMGSLGRIYQSVKTVNTVQLDQTSSLLAIENEIQSVIGMISSLPTTDNTSSITQILNEVSGVNSVLSGLATHDDVTGARDSILSALSCLDSGDITQILSTVGDINLTTLQTKEELTSTQEDIKAKLTLTQAEIQDMQSSLSQQMTTAESDILSAIGNTGNDITTILGNVSGIGGVLSGLATHDDVNGARDSILSALSGLDGGDITNILSTVLETKDLTAQTKDLTQQTQEELGFIRSEIEGVQGSLSQQITSTENDILSALNTTGNDITTILGNVSGIGGVLAGLATSSQLSTVESGLQSKLDDIESSLSGFQQAITNIAQIDADFSSLNSNVNDIEGSVVNINTNMTQIANNLAAVQQETTALASLAKTIGADNVINSLLNDKTIIDSVNVIFPGTDGLLTNGSYTIQSGQRLATLFGCNPDDVYALTPSDKLTIVFKALFGISDSDFNTTVGQVDDSGVVLTKVLDAYLGTNRDGTNAINMFSQFTSRKHTSSGSVGNISAGGSVSDFFASYAPGVTNDVYRLKVLLQNLRTTGTPIAQPVH